MRRADRLFQIVQLLRRDRATTATQLATELEVSERTIYRYVQDLMQSGVPIQGEAGVGYALPSHFDLPPLMFTAVELQALVLGARMVQGWADDELQRAARSALAKVEQVLPRALAADAAASRLFVPDFHVDRAQRPTLLALRQALTEARALQLDYADEVQAPSRRTVRPLGLYYWGRVWTLVGWCELRSDFRSFRVDRITAVVVLERRCTDEPGKRLDDFLARVQAEDPWRDSGAANERADRRAAKQVTRAPGASTAKSKAPPPAAGRPAPRRTTKNGAPTDPAERAAWRTFQQLGSVGPATAGDLLLLGFRTVDELRGQDPRVLYDRMCALTQSRQDPCVEDAFRCVIAQAEHPDLPEPWRQWHHWTPLRGQPPGSLPPELQLRSRRR